MDDHDSLLSRGNAEEPPHAWRPGRGPQPARQAAPAARTEVWSPQERAPEPTEARDDPRQAQRRPATGYPQRAQQPAQGYPGQAQPTQAYGQGYAGPAQGGYPPQNQPGQGYPQGYPAQGGYPTPGQGNPGGYGQSYDDGPQFGNQLPPGGPGGYSYDSPPRRNGPKTGTVIVALLGAVAAAIVAGVLIGFVRQSPDPNASLNPGPSTTPPAATQSSGPAQPSPSNEPSSTTTAAEAVERIGWVEQPWTRKGMDFGILKGVSRDGDKVSLSFDRAAFLVGKDAEAYFKKHPNQEPQDYALVNTNSKVRRFELVADAEVYGTYLLGDQQQVHEQQLSVDDLVAKFQALPNKQDGLLVWLRHRDGDDGPVTYLAEQFIP